MPFMLYWSQSSPVPPCSHSSHLLSLHTPSSRRVSMHSTNHETSCTRARNGNNMAKFEQQAMQTCSIGSGVVLIPLAVLAMNLNGPATVEAGILSGATGLESFELPRLPQTDVFKDITEANKKRYKDLDAKFKASPFLQELLKRSKENAVKNKREIEDKYCLRGAEWGVGDCSLAAASKEEKEAFLKAFEKRNAGN
ncbi:hypothetical protein O6H91_Y393300 [Diphasiastrum complanatum]|nr:hypothetical protein O6H91_Y393300 [Diphasiastrum complanatum]